MSHARIEEVSDSDPEIDDPEEFLPDSDIAPIRPAGQASSSSSSSRQRPQHQTTSVNPSLFRPPPPPQAHDNYEQSRQTIKHYCTIYPCYFSSARTRSQGRRVPKELATPNPLAFNILDALRDIIDPEVNQIHIAFEPDKSHPKDWSNPGRVRIELFDPATHQSKHPKIGNKQHLFDEVGKWLQAHPAQNTDPLKLKIAHLPVPEKFLETQIAKPKGWEAMNDILPLHSAAVSGGGVKDDFLKEAMAEMKQMQGAGGAGAGSGGMPDFQQMMQSMGGLGGMGGMPNLGALGNMFGGGAGGFPGGGGGGGGSGGGESSGSKKKGKKK